ncbi:RnfABCDGE type electron transport complex subunit B [Allopusillimonas soli]|uniref:RnfABCDGE type electron transport complex subunit B n=1 Tax=Allopusillimonas soli TaxID=659016 RepID=A0A853FHN8_9BURK|nr:RnfABCDGE type electron transport complex subunit B [Allopusillimonas soli]NYT38300.1 RnfABCDGE type electron transport complex subunit B [Allopusillimonas soli]TEA72128.1 RnfABCDGE type electron transport complex subunit B [Allopusillimonas soli]
MSSNTLVDRIDAILPQTQCTRCGFDGCLPYAHAMANAQAPINRCPPGGDEVIRKLAALLDTETIALDPDCGQHGPPLLAVIDEAHCIGCTLCIQACPVDAIIGANKVMHTVLPDQCTGCELCVAPCPVDCIAMEPDPQPWSDARAHAARVQHRAREARLSRLHHEDSALAARTLANKAPVSAHAADDADARRQAIERALARARERRRQFQ